MIVSISKAAKILGISQTKLRHLTDAGQVKCYKTPWGHRRFDTDELVIDHSDLVDSKASTYKPSTYKATTLERIATALETLVNIYKENHDRQKIYIQSNDNKHDG